MKRDKNNVTASESITENGSDDTENKSKKKIVYEIELKIRKDKSSYFSFYRFSMMQRYEYEKTFNFDRPK